MSMLKHLLAAGTASLVLILSGAPVLASNSTGGVILYSPVDGVTVVTVSTAVNDVELDDEVPSVIVTNNIVVVVAAPSRRLAYLRGILGQRYLGFKRLYSGPRYPF
jgi:hypothetical protein